MKQFIIFLLLMPVFGSAQDYNYLTQGGVIATGKRYDSTTIKAALDAKVTINGTANQLFGMNNAGTAQEAKSVTATGASTITNAANSIVVGTVSGYSGDYYTTGGSANAYTLTPSPAIGSYITGQVFNVKFHAASTTASTINISGLGVKSLVKYVSTALVSGDIPINQIYTIVYDGTNFLVQDIGFRGINTSAILLGSLSDETGTGTSVFNANPVFATGITGSATMGVFNTTSTTVNAFGASTTLTIGNTPTTAVTANILTNATATATTKAINFGTAGASGSTTNIAMGSAVAGANSFITLSGYTVRPPQYVQSTTGQTVTVASTETVIDPAGTLATLTIALPASPVNGQLVHISFSQIITALSFSGGTLANAVTTAAAGSALHLVYQSTATKWFVQ